MGEFLIRAVRPADADELGAAHVAIWRAAYAGVLERAKLDALDPAASAARWRDTIIPATAEQERSGVRTRCAVHVKHGFERDGATKTDERWACTDERMVRP